MSCLLRLKRKASLALRTESRLEKTFSMGINCMGRQSIVGFNTPRPSSMLPVPFIYTWVKRENMEQQSFLSKKKHSSEETNSASNHRRLDLESPTRWPPHLHIWLVPSRLLWSVERRSAREKRAGKDGIKVSLFSLPPSTRPVRIVAVLVSSRPYNYPSLLSTLRDHKSWDGWGRLSLHMWLDRVWTHNDAIVLWPCQ